MISKSDFIAIIKQNEGIIFKISKAYAKDNEDQKDLYQEIVYQLWKSFEGFRNEAKVSTWIYRVALNTSISHLNQRKKKGSSVPIDFEQLNIADETDSLMEERMNMLYTQIKQLNIIDRGIILLFLEGKNYEEIAKITGFTKTNVGTKLNRIKQKLKTKILNH